MTDMSFLDNKVLPQSAEPQETPYYTGSSNRLTETETDPGLLPSAESESSEADSVTDPEEESPAEDETSWADEALEGFQPSNQGLYADAEFNRKDVERILQFCLQYYAANSERQAFLRQLFGWSVHYEPQAYDIAMGLKDAGESIASYATFASITRMFTRGETDIMETLRVGASIAEMDSETIRDLFQKTRAFTGTNISYRRDMTSLKVMEKLQEALSSADSSQVETLEWIDEMVAVWPGMNI